MQNYLYCPKKVPKSIVAPRVVIVRSSLSVVLSAGFPWPPPSLLLGEGRRGASGLQMGGGRRNQGWSLTTQSAVKHTRNYEG